MYEHISKCVRKGRKVYNFSAFFFALFVLDFEFSVHVAFDDFVFGFFGGVFDFHFESDFGFAVFVFDFKLEFAYLLAVPSRRFRRFRIRIRLPERRFQLLRIV